MAYQYKMVQAAPHIRLEKETGSEAADYLEGVVNRYAQQGWEFYRVDSIGVVVKPGCLAGLFGARSYAVNYHVITFRKST